MYVCMQRIYQPGKAVDPARDKLNRKNVTFFLSRSRHLVSRDRFGRPVPRQSARSQDTMKAESSI